MSCLQNCCLWNKQIDLQYLISGKIIDTYLSYCLNGSWEDPNPKLNPKALNAITIALSLASTVAFDYTKTGTYYQAFLSYSQHVKLYKLHAMTLLEMKRKDLLLVDVVCKPIKCALSIAETSL